MKKKRIAMMLMLALLCGTGIQAQIVTGGNLNIGTGNVLSPAPYGNAIGQCNHTYGGNSLAVGENDTISEGSTNSFAAGSHNKVTGVNSFAIGGWVKTIGMYSMGIGYNIKTITNRNMVMGWGLMGNITHPDKYLENDCPYSLMVGYKSTKPTLTVGPSPNNYPNGSDYELTGKVAIGNVPVPDIAAKLHIRSDEGEDASILLQPNSNERAYIWFSDKYHELGVNSDGSMNLLSINSAFRLESNNANLSNGEFTLGCHNEKKISLTTSGFPALYANAYRIGNSYAGFKPGSCFAIEFKGDTMAFRSAFASSTSRSFSMSDWQDLMMLKTNGSIVMNGKVGVNVENTTTNYALAVDGGIITTKVYIQDVQNWPDYVFGDSYKLMPLHELKAFICDNRHLPEMPAGSEIEGQGYDMQEMQQAMMRKIEELTLYTLQQQEEIEALRKTVEELKKGK